MLSSSLSCKLIHSIRLTYNRILIFVQTTNLMRGETTVERYGKKAGKQGKVSVLDTPKKKLNLEYNIYNEQDRGCLVNCGMMLCSSQIKS